MSDQIGARSEVAPGSAATAPPVESEGAGREQKALKVLSELEAWLACDGYEDKAISLALAMAAIFTAGCNREADLMALVRDMLPYVNINYRKLYRERLDALKAAGVEG